MARQHDPEERYQALLRTRYERFIGDFVLHCHIVQHGDQGMMQNLRIVPPRLGEIADRKLVVLNPLL